MYKYYSYLLFGIASVLGMTTVFSAEPINLNSQPVTVLNSFLSSGISQSTIKKTGSMIDFNQTTHIRIQQLYAGYPVFGADAVLHIPHHTKVLLQALPANTTMNGTLYQNLTADLNNVPLPLLADKALQHALSLYQQKTGIKRYDLAHAKKNLIVYVDHHRCAHWAYLVAFLAPGRHGEPAIPTYILDAFSFNVYEEWNDAKTLDDSYMGGFGGNVKMGKVIYDDAVRDKPFLDVERDAATKTCYLTNQDVAVLDVNLQKDPSGAPIARFPCYAPDSRHDYLYWDGDEDAVNGGFSPANDALYLGQVIRNMYRAWYDVPVLKDGDHPMVIKMNVHAQFFGWTDFAMFSSYNNEMYFGDGLKEFYPLTSLDVGAHEISHGFTSQYSNLVYEKQSGGLNESFSDMAAKAAEFYLTRHNHWEIGADILKGPGALRYMDDPTKDGKSIDNIKNYNDDLEPHITSGIFNKVFYLMSTAPSWDTQKAFNVMVDANMSYWTSTTTFLEAACGVLQKTKDRGYDIDTVKKAFVEVGIDTHSCQLTDSKQISKNGIKDVV